MFLSPTISRQIVQEAIDLGRATELQVTKHITSNYGGIILDNAALVEQYWPLGAKAPSNIDAHAQNMTVVPGPTQHQASDRPVSTPLPVWAGPSSQGLGTTTLP